MSVVSRSSADVVDLEARNPSWWSAGCRRLFSDGRISVSSTLAAGQRSEIGRKDLPCDESLPGFGNGMMVDIFQMDGRRLLLMESLCSAEKKFKAKGPRCLRWKNG